MLLDDYGWSAQIAEQFEPFRQEGYAAGRVIQEHKLRYLVMTECGERSAAPTGAFLYHTDERDALPTVGDWVVLRLHGDSDPQATMHALLPRQSAFRRKEAGQRTGAQVVAANVETLFILLGLDGDFNLRRLERYLALSGESGARPVVLLTKADLCAEAEERRQAVEEVAAGAPVHVISVLRGAGLAELSAYLLPGQTLALLGSSGVGKSSLLNALLGQPVQATRAVREDDSHGRHTTTHRELFRLPGGALVIDTPGMRELQLWGTDDGLAGAFADIDALAAHCRYRDCRHEGEPGCAVQAALDAGDLPYERYASYRKLRQELLHLAARQDHTAEQTLKRRGKQLAKQIKQYFKEQQRE